MSEPTDSPYRPPEAEIAAPVHSRPRYEPTGTFSVSRCVQDAWDAMLRNIGPFLGLMGLVLVGWIGFTLFTVAAAAAAAGAGGGAALFVVIGLVILLLYLVALPVLAWGLAQFGLSAIDGRAKLGDLFSLFERPGERFVKTLSLGFVLFLASLPGTVPQFAIQLQGGPNPDFALLALAWVWNVVWGQVVSVRLFFSLFFVVDRGMDVGAALRTSWDWTRGNTLRFLGLLVVVFGMTLAGFAALVVGLIPAMVLVGMLYPSAFRQIAGERDSVIGARAA